MSLPPAIAIDGPVASGKTSVGREVARRTGYRFIDTGLMYRACTYLALRSGVDVGDEAALAALAKSARIRLISGDPDQVLVDEEDVTGFLRRPDVEAAVSAVSQVAGVRAAMVAAQRRMAQHEPVVMVGRDIGTEVLPDAAKVFLDASPDERVRRRLAELEGRGEAADAELVRENLELRDRMDAERSEGPLRVAADALRVDTDGLDVHGVAQRVIELLSAGVH